MRVLVLYKSKYGTAKQYAQWIHEEILGSSFASVDDYDFQDINNYETVVIVSSTYAGDIKSREFLVKNWDKMKDKRVYLLAVGLVFSEDAKKTFELIPEEIRNSITYNKIPGRIMYDKLNVLEKIMVKMMHGEHVDKVDRKYIEPVVSYVNSFS